MRWILRLSDATLRLEKRMMMLLVAVLVLLMLFNIVTRALGAAAFWTDELAIYVMIWMALLGASAMVRMRSGVAVTLVADLLPRALQRYLARVVDGIVVVLAVVLLWVTWLWYDPLALGLSGMDFAAFAEKTFKFIYYEPTNTIGINKFWVWLAVPFMSIGMTLHAIANLLEGPPATNGTAEI